MKFSKKVGEALVNKWLNFGGDPDHGSGSRHATEEEEEFCNNDNKNKKIH